MNKKMYQNKTFGKTKYGVHTLPARRAFFLGLKVKSLLPVGGSFLDAQTSNALDGMKFQTIASAFMDNLDALDLEALLDEIVFSRIDVNGQTLENPDEHFADNLGEMLDVIAWVLEVNFKSLFLGSTLVQKMLSKLKIAGVIPTWKGSPVEVENEESVPE